MKQYKEEISEEYLDKIIAVAYGDASLLDKIKVYIDARKDERVKQILMQYKSTASVVHSIAKESLEDSIKTKRISKHPILTNALRFVVYRPAVSSAFVAGLIIILAAVILLKKPEPRQTYTRAQVELAEKQVKESFAIVAAVFNRSSNEIRNDVLDKKVGQKLQKGVSIINDILKERVENEN